MPRREEREKDTANGLNSKQLVMMGKGDTGVPGIILTNVF